MRVFINQFNPTTNEMPEELYYQWCNLVYNFVLNNGVVSTKTEKYVEHNTLLGFNMHIKTRYDFTDNNRATNPIISPFYADTVALHEPADIIAALLYFGVNYKHTKNKSKISTPQDKAHYQQQIAEILAFGNQKLNKSVLKYYYAFDYIDDLMYYLSYEFECKNKKNKEEWIVYFSKLFKQESSKRGIDLNTFQSQIKGFANEKRGLINQIKAYRNEDDAFSFTTNKIINILNSKNNV